MRKVDILDRIVTWYGLRNKTELARFLGVTPQTISNWYSRDSIDYDLIFSRCVGVDLNWLVLGATNYVEKRRGANVSVVSDVVGSYGRAGQAAVADPEAHTVAVVDDETACSIVVPEGLLPAGTYRIFRIGDDAMAPNFVQGGYVLCKRIVDFAEMRAQSGKPYVIVAKSGKAVLRRLRDDDGVSGKMIFTADHSNRDRYPDVAFSASEIESAWRVEWTILRYEEDYPDLYRRLQDMERNMADIRRAVAASMTYTKK